MSLQMTDARVVARSDYVVRLAQTQTFPARGIRTELTERGVKRLRDLAADPHNGPTILARELSIDVSTLERLAAQHDIVVPARRRNMSSSAWDDERVAALKTAWAKGDSAGMIAKAMGCGLTRNAVLGKVHRLGLPTRTDEVRKINHHASAQGQNVRRLTEEQLGRRREAAARRAAKALLPPAEPRAKPLKSSREVAVAAALALPAMATPDQLSPHMCKWPVGHPGEPDFGFCGRLKPHGGPYCEGHALAGTKAGGDDAAKDLARTLRRYL